MTLQPKDGSTGPGFPRVTRVPSLMPSRHSPFNSINYPTCLLSAVSSLGYVTWWEATKGMVSEIGYLRC